MGRIGLGRMSRLGTATTALAIFFCRTLQEVAISQILLFNYLLQRYRKNNNKKKASLINSKEALLTSK